MACVPRGWNVATGGVKGAPCTARGKWRGPARGQSGRSRRRTLPDAAAPFSTIRAAPSETPP
jgi:hypothetical protein